VSCDAADRLLSDRAEAPTVSERLAVACTQAVFEARGELILNRVAVVFALGVVVGVASELG
jgi:hypothetical protein